MQMFGETQMDKKQAYMQGFGHFVFSMVLFLIVGMPLANIPMPFKNCGKYYSYHKVCCYFS